MKWKQPTACGGLADAQGAALASYHRCTLFFFTPEVGPTKHPSHWHAAASNYRESVGCDLRGGHGQDVDGITCQETETLSAAVLLSVRGAWALP